MSEKRIQKVLSEQGICSRRQAEAFIEAGYIQVNGTTIQNPATKINPNEDNITLDPKAQEILTKRTTIKYYKPRGIVTHSAQEEETAIIDIIDPAYKKLAPIGRLDKDSEGLLLLSDDGVFAKRCLQHEKPFSREYEVHVSKPLTTDMIQKCETGLTLFGKKTKPCCIQKCGPRKYRFTMIEGKNRQIRRMVQKVGSAVTKLQRIRFGPIHVGELKPNQVEIIQTF
jgi:23S rRNA pseudouridine2604 synthase